MLTGIGLNPNQYTALSTFLDIQDETLDLDELEQALLRVTNNDLQDGGRQFHSSYNTYHDESGSLDDYDYDYEDYDCQNGENDEPYYDDDDDEIYSVDENIFWHETEQVYLLDDIVNDDIYEVEYHEDKWYEVTDDGTYLEANQCRICKQFGHWGNDCPTKGGSGKKGKSGPKGSPKGKTDSNLSEDAFFSRFRRYGKGGKRFRRNNFRKRFRKRFHRSYFEDDIDDIESSGSLTDINYGRRRFGRRRFFRKGNGKGKGKGKPRFRRRFPRNTFFENDEKEKEDYEPIFSAFDHVNEVECLTTPVGDIDGCFTYVSSGNSLMSSKLKPNSKKKKPSIIPVHLQPPPNLSTEGNYTSEWSNKPTLELSTVENTILDIEGDQKEKQNLSVSNCNYSRKTTSVMPAKLSKPIQQKKPKAKPRGRPPKAKINNTASIEKSSADVEMKEEVKAEEVTEVKSGSLALDYDLSKLVLPAAMKKAKKPDVLSSFDEIFAYLEKYVMCVSMHLNLVDVNPALINTPDFNDVLLTINGNKINECPTEDAIERLSNLGIFEANFPAIFEIQFSSKDVRVKMEPVEEKEKPSPVPPIAVDIISSGDEKEPPSEAFLTPHSEKEEKDVQMKSENESMRDAEPESSVLSDSSEHTESSSASSRRSDLSGSLSDQSDLDELEKTVNGAKKFDPRVDLQKSYLTYMTARDLYMENLDAFKDRTDSLTEKERTDMSIIRKQRKRASFLQQMCDILDGLNRNIVDVENQIKLGTKLNKNEVYPPTDGSGSLLPPTEGYKKLISEIEENYADNEEDDESVTTVDKTTAGVSSSGSLLAEAKSEKPSKTDRAPALVDRSIRFEYKVTMEELTVAAMSQSTQSDFFTVKATTLLRNFGIPNQFTDFGINFGGFIPHHDFAVLNGFSPFAEGPEISPENQKHWINQVHKWLAVSDKNLRLRQAPDALIHKDAQLETLKNQPKTAPCEMNVTRISGDDRKRIAMFYSPLTFTERAFGGPLQISPVMKFQKDIVKNSKILENEVIPLDTGFAGQFEKTYIWYRSGAKDRYNSIDTEKCDAEYCQKHLYLRQDDYFDQEYKKKFSKAILNHKKAGDILNRKTEKFPEIEDRIDFMPNPFYKSDFMGLIYKSLMRVKVNDAFYVDLVQDYDEDKLDAFFNGPKDQHKRGPAILNYVCWEATTHNLQNEFEYTRDLPPRHDEMFNTEIAQFEANHCKSPLWPSWRHTSARDLKLHKEFCKIPSGSLQGNSNIPFSIGKSNMPNSTLREAITSDPVTFMKLFYAQEHDQTFHSFHEERGEKLYTECYSPQQKSGSGSLLPDYADKSSVLFCEKGRVRKVLSKLKSPSAETYKTRMMIGNTTDKRIVFLFDELLYDMVRPACATMMTKALEVECAIFNKWYELDKLLSGSLPEDNTPYEVLKYADDFPKAKLFLKLFAFPELCLRNISSDFKKVSLEDTKNMIFEEARRRSDPTLFSFITEIPEHAFKMHMRDISKRGKWFSPKNVMEDKVFQKYHDQIDKSFHYGNRIDPHQYILDRIPISIDKSMSHMIQPMTKFYLSIRSTLLEKLGLCPTGILDVKIPTDIWELLNLDVNDVKKRQDILEYKCENLRIAFCSTQPMNNIKLGGHVCGHEIIRAINFIEEIALARADLLVLKENKAQVHQEKFEHFTAKRNESRAYRYVVMKQIQDMVNDRKHCDNLKDCESLIAHMQKYTAAKNESSTADITYNQGVDSLPEILASKKRIKAHKVCSTLLKCGENVRNLIDTEKDFGSLEYLRENGEYCVEALDNLSTLTDDVFLQPLAYCDSEVERIASNFQNPFMKFFYEARYGCLKKQLKFDYDEQKFLGRWLGFTNSAAWTNPAIALAKTPAILNAKTVAEICANIAECESRRTNSPERIAKGDIPFPSVLLEHGTRDDIFDVFLKQKLSRVKFRILQKECEMDEILTKLQNQRTSESMTFKSCNSEKSSNLFIKHNGKFIPERIAYGKDSEFKMPSLQNYSGSSDFGFEDLRVSRDDLRESYFLHVLYLIGNSRRAAEQRARRIAKLKPATYSHRIDTNSQNKAVRSLVSRPVSNVPVSSLTIQVNSQDSGDCDMTNKVRKSQHFKHAQKKDTQKKPVKQKKLIQSGSPKNKEVTKSVMQHGKTCDQSSTRSSGKSETKKKAVENAKHCAKQEDSAADDELHAHYEKSVKERVSEIEQKSPAKEKGTSVSVDPATSGHVNQLSHVDSPRKNEAEKFKITNIEVQTNDESVSNQKDTSTRNSFSEKSKSENNPQNGEIVKSARRGETTTVSTPRDLQSQSERIASRCNSDQGQDSNRNSKEIAQNEKVKEVDTGVQRIAIGHPTKDVEMDMEGRQPVMDVPGNGNPGDSGTTGLVADASNVQDVRMQGDDQQPVLASPEEVTNGERIANVDGETTDENDHEDDKSVQSDFLNPDKPDYDYGKNDEEDKNKSDDEDEESDDEEDESTSVPPEETRPSTSGIMSITAPADEFNPEEYKEKIRTQFGDTIVTKLEFLISVILFRNQRSTLRNHMLYASAEKILAKAAQDPYAFSERAIREAAENSEKHLAKLAAPREIQPAESYRNQLMHSSNTRQNHGKHLTIHEFDVLCDHFPKIDQLIDHFARPLHPDEFNEENVQQMEEERARAVALQQRACATQGVHTKIRGKQIVQELRIRREGSAHSVERIANTTETDQNSDQGKPKKAKGKKMPKKKAKEKSPVTLKPNEEVFLHRTQQGSFRPSLTLSAKTLEKVTKKFPGFDQETWPEPFYDRKNPDQVVWCHPQTHVPLEETELKIFEEWMNGDRQTDFVAYLGLNKNRFPVPGCGRSLLKIEDTLSSKRNSQNQNWNQNRETDWCSNNSWNSNQSKNWKNWSKQGSRQRKNSSSSSYHKWNKGDHSNSSKETRSPQPYNDANKGKQKGGGKQQGGKTQGKLQWGKWYNDSMTKVIPKIKESYAAYKLMIENNPDTLISEKVPFRDWVSQTQLEQSLNFVIPMWFWINKVYKNWDNEMWHRKNAICVNGNPQDEAPIKRMRQPFLQKMIDFHGWTNPDVDREDENVEIYPLERIASMDYTDFNSSKYIEKLKNTDRVSPERIANTFACMDDSDMCDSFKVDDGSLLKPTEILIDSGCGTAMGSASAVSRLKRATVLLGFKTKEMESEKRFNFAGGIFEG